MYFAKSDEIKQHCDKLFEAKQRLMYENINLENELSTLTTKIAKQKTNSAILSSSFMKEQAEHARRIALFTKELAEKLDNSHLPPSTQGKKKSNVDPKTGLTKKEDPYVEYAKAFYKTT